MSQAALWRRFADQVARLRSRLPARPATSAPSPAQAWLAQLPQAQGSSPAAGEALRVRAACLSQAERAQAVSSQARALLLASAGSALLSAPAPKKNAAWPQVPDPGTDSSGKE